MDHRITYLRDPKGNPVGCVAIRLSESRRLAIYQLSVLNPADRFNRSVARQLALGRMVEAPLTARLPYDANGNVSKHTITEAVFRNIQDDHRAPARARKAARSWLRANGLWILIGAGGSTHSRAPDPYIVA